MREGVHRERAADCIAGMAHVLASDHPPNPARFVASSLQRCWFDICSSVSSSTNVLVYLCPLARALRDQATRAMSPSSANTEADEGEGLIAHVAWSPAVPKINTTYPLCGDVSEQVRKRHTVHVWPACLFHPNTVSCLCCLCTCR